MTSLVIHKTAQDFLNSNYSFLIKDELANNLTMGVSLGLENRNEEIPDYDFLSVVNGEKIEAVSVRTTPRILMSGDGRTDSAVSLISEYYNSVNSKIKGIIGEKRIAKTFAESIDLIQTGKRDLLVHELHETNDITISNGRLEQAILADVELITNYRTKFDLETFGFARLSYDDTLKDTISKIDKGSMFKWTDKGIILSIAAIMRVTKNIGIIGLVYTPEEMRKKGFAISIVKTLSDEIFKRGYSKCGLFTDVLNPASNHVYAKIGYIPKLEFTDIYLG